MQVHIHSVATARAPHELPQDLVARRARKLLGDRYPGFDRVARSFGTAGIETRRSVAPIDWFEAPHGWADRNETYLDGARALFDTAAEAALDEAGWRADQVDVIVTISSTGIATPTLEAQSALSFRPDVLRIPVFGLGCAGGVSGLSIAQGQAAGRPGARVLLVVVEACTVSFRADRLRKSDIVAAILFGDGAAGACLSTETPRGQAITCGPGTQTTWPDTLDIMGWDVDDTGFGVVFDRSIPDFVLDRFADAAGDALHAFGLSRDDVAKFVCHPGGAKVLDALTDTLALPANAMTEERETLRLHGNMSAPTVLFVLREVLDGDKHGTMVACALGPGFTAAFLPLSVPPKAPQ
ncbi:MAG: 3-oxoacyl-[acyl-carrier-protein] synthase III C-terminal domain-containing protein [Pseudomonadota bacterium]